MDRYGEGQFEAGGPDLRRGWPVGNFAHHLGRNGGCRVLGAQRPLVGRLPANRSLGRRPVVAGAGRRTGATKAPAGGLLPVAPGRGQGLRDLIVDGGLSDGPEEQIGGITENEPGEG